MRNKTSGDDLAKRVRDFVLDGFTPHFGELSDAFRDDPSWRRVKELTGELWLDTGSIEDATELWTRWRIS